MIDQLDSPLQTKTKIINKHPLNSQGTIEHRAKKFKILKNSQICNSKDPRASESKELEITSERA